MKSFLNFGAAAALVMMAQIAAAHDIKAQDAAKAEEQTKHVPSVKAGTLLNTDVTPQQAKEITEATNRQILRQRKQGATR